MANGSLNHFVRRQFPWSMICLALFAAIEPAQRSILAATENDENPSLVKTVFSAGIEIRDGFAAEIGKPTLLEVESGKRLDAVKKLAPRIPWQRFSQDSVFAPVVIKTEAVDGPNGTRLAYRVRSAFLVHATMDALQDKELMQAALMNSKKDDDSSSQSDEVTETELSKVGIPPPPENVSYGKVSIPLLNRVSLSGVIQAEKFEGEGYLGVAWQMDPRFAGTELASSWQLMKRNNLGQPELGPAQSYQGCGGFITVFEVEPGLLLVESKFVMHEPAGWFGGSQFLRSKLPPALQENARSFRRSLKDAAKE